MPIRWPYIALLFVATLLTACTPSKPEDAAVDSESPHASQREAVPVSIDLLSRMPAADIRSSDVGVGPLDIGDHERFTTGWHAPERADSGSFTRWLGAPSGAIDITLTRLEPLDLRLTLAPPQGKWIPDQRVQLFFNGHDLGTAVLEHVEQVLLQRVSPRIQRIGLNRIELMPAVWIDRSRLEPGSMPEDISVLLKRLELIPVKTGSPRRASKMATALREGRLVQTPDSVVTVSLPIPQEATLSGTVRIRFPESFEAGKAGGLVRVVIDELDEVGKVLWRKPISEALTASEFALDANLADYAGKLVSISLVASSGAAGDESSTFEVVWESLQLDGHTEAARPREARSLDHRPNVLVVLFDTLRADHTEPYGAEHVQTPNMKRLAQEGVTFINTTASSSWTRSSVATLFTATNVSFHKTATFEDVFSDGIPYLPEILRDNGYATTGISFNGHITAQWGFGRGFDALHELGKERPKFLRDHPTAEGYAAHIWDEYIAPATENPDRPFFVYLHDLDPHAPYEPMEPYDSLYPTAYRGKPGVLGKNIHLIRTHYTKLKPADYQYLNAKYRGEISFMDAVLGALLDRLSDTGLRENTVVVFLSDHGEEFGEHGGAGHSVTVHSEVLNVPFIWSWDGSIQRGAAVKSQAGLIDFSPTLLDLLGIEISTTMQGASLVSHFERKASPLARRPYLMSIGDRTTRGSDAVQWGPWKLIRDRVYGRASYALYHQENDPDELENVWSSRPVVGTALKQMLKWRLMQDELQSPVSVKRIPTESLDPEVVERLENLGYLQ